MAAQLLLLARYFTPPALADGELLDRFTRTRENEAFSELVRRHGPVVYRICRRLVGPTAADDAFQATFLLLATRSTAARAAGSVGGWLVGVAGRVARQMRRAEFRRTHHETTAANQHPITEAEPALDLLDQFRILDEELARLPDRLRAPVTSCLLQGQTQEQAAKESGQTTRTIRRRLEEARRLLRVRLMRRGVTPVVVTGLVAGLGATSMAVPAGLEPRTVAAVFDFLTGGGVASPPVVLAKGVATTMLARKIMPLMMAVAVGLTGLGFVLGNDGGPVQPPTNAKAPATGIPTLLAPKPEEPKERPPEKPGRQPTLPVKSGELTVMIQVLCARVPAGFCEECGLTGDEAGTKTGGKSSLVVTGLNRREVKMLEALIRAKKREEQLDVLSEPKLLVADGQTGFFQTGEPVEVVTGFETTNANGKTVSTPKIQRFGSSSSTLQLTPEIYKDKGEIHLRIHLRIESKTAQVAGGVIEVPVTPAGSPSANTRTVLPIASLGVDLGKGNKTVAFSEATVRTNMMLPPGGAVVLGGLAESGSGGAKKTELFWVLTAHVVRGKP